MSTVEHSERAFSGVGGQTKKLLSFFFFATNWKVKQPQIARPCLEKVNLLPPSHSSQFGSCKVAAFQYQYDGLHYCTGGHTLVLTFHRRLTRTEKVRGSLNLNSDAGAARTENVLRQDRI